MGEIKFKVFRKENNKMPKMSEPFTLKEFIELKSKASYHIGKAEGFEGKEENLEDFWCKEDGLFLQFTGLKDCKGVEIYEGDIISLVYETVRMIGFVKQQDDGEWIFYKNEGNFLGVHHNKEHISVIGNIYENPELLK